MFDFIKGTITELTPAYVVVECGGIGYILNISLNSYSGLSGKTQCIIFVHHVIREDAHTLFGFVDKNERDVFRSLISVTGVGPNTGRMIMSSLSPDDVRKAIIQNNVSLLKSIKGIGLKTAQRLIVDLKDKIGKTDPSEIFITSDNTIREEALSALVMLGFAKNNAEKAVGQIISENPKISVEELVKTALKRL